MSLFTVIGFLWRSSIVWPTVSKIPTNSAFTSGPFSCCVFSGTENVISAAVGVSLILKFVTKSSSMLFLSAKVDFFAPSRKRL